MALTKLSIPSATIALIKSAWIAQGKRSLCLLSHHVLNHSSEWRGQGETNRSSGRNGGLIESKLLFLLLLIHSQSLFYIVLFCLFVFLPWMQKKYGGSHKELIPAQVDWPFWGPFRWKLCFSACSCVWGWIDKIDLNRSKRNKSIFDPYK